MGIALSPSSFRRAGDRGWRLVGAVMVGRGSGRRRRNDRRNRIAHMSIAAVSGSKVILHQPQFFESTEE